MGTESDPKTGEREKGPLPTGLDPRPRILVADDEPGIRWLASTVLTRSGYAVDAVVDGAAAWEALNAARYDLLITDHLMPKVTGVELLKRLEAAHLSVPVVMATGTPPDEEFTRNPSLQPAATLLKPYSVAQLLGAVKEVLGLMKGLCGRTAESNCRIQRSTWEERVEAAAWLK